MLRRLVAAALILAVAMAAHLTGLLRPVDDGLMAMRMRAAPRQPTGRIVVVDIDAKSIDAIGSWPWPRRLHAELIDKLVALGAAEIAFDIDFSSATNLADDSTLEAAIKRAAGKITLAAFVQKQTTGANAVISFNRPLPRFAENAWVGSVNVRQDSDGLIRKFGYGLILDGKIVPSIPAILAGGVGEPGREFGIDFSIDATAIDRISLIDVLRGDVDPARLSGKKVIVGAQALELRDFFNAPVAGTISGPLLQAEATETLMQGRALRHSSFVVALTGLIIIALAAFAIGRLRWLAMIGALAGVALTTEMIAAWTQAKFAFAIDTAPWHLALGTFAVLVLVNEIDFRELLQTMWRVRANNAEALLSKVVADNFAGVVVIDEDGVIRAASRSASELLGKPRRLAGAKAREVLPPELIAGVDAALIVPVNDRAVWRPSVVQVERLDGARRNFEFVTTVSQVESETDGKTGKPDSHRVVCLTFTDVTEQHAAEERIAYLARFDLLTRLPNRNQVVEKLEEVFVSADTQIRASAVVTIDLDSFKTVNDDLGHQTGDLLLQRVAERITTLLPPKGLVARLAGDEFAAIFMGGNARDEAIAFAKRAVAIVDKPFQLGDHRVVITTSAGVALADARDKGPDDILRRADVALYRAKAEGGNTATIFERAMLQTMVDRQKLEADLWQALERREFEVWYQPQIELATGRITGVEALLRWRHPERGLVSPNEFIPVAEAIGLIDELGRWVLDTACLEVAKWPYSIRLSVNVSSAQFAHSDMAEVVGSALQHSGLSPFRLDVEITESLFMQPSRTVHAALARLRDLGVSIALDDFGTGYSSLSYIQKFPITKIKLDKSFVAGLPDNAGSAAIVRAVAGLAKDLSLQLNAEGVETAAQSAFLQSLGVDEVQGYLYGKPQTWVDLSTIVAPMAEAERRRA